MPSEIENEPIRFGGEGGHSLRDLVERCPPESVIELAPGRYAGPVHILKPLTIRGAGDLTRIVGDRRGAVVTISAANGGRVALESLLVEEGEGETGGGVLVQGGRVRLQNVHLRHCRAERGAGGGVHVSGGEVDATLLRIENVSADRGGAVWAGGRSVVRIRDAQILRSEARLGGALAVEEGAQVSLEGVTIGKARATASSGGQVFYVSGSKRASPVLRLTRVRLEGAPMGSPLVVDPSHPGEVSVAECDLPRVVLAVRGVVDGGENRWR